MGELAGRVGGGWLEREVEVGEERRWIEGLVVGWVGCWW